MHRVTWPKLVEPMAFRFAWGLQVALLCGLGSAFVLAPASPVDAGLRDCVEESDCTFRKPNLMILVDYSSSMNEDFGGVSRWQATVDAIAQMIDADNGFLGDNLNLALMRVGHDPDRDPDTGEGTVLPGDTSDPPIVDGQALDVYWYDPTSPNLDYTQCNGEAVKTALESLPPPACLPHPSGTGCSGIGTWTKGALDRTQQLIATSRADHGESLDTRLYLNLVLTDGAWTGPDGATQVDTEDPSLTAADLFDNDQVPTYVVAVSTGADVALADELASAGGTVQAIDGSTPESLVNELQAIVAAIKDELIEPECVGGMPRVMIVLDASSSMLNVDGGAALSPGLHGWDQAREALAGSDSIFDVVVQSGETIEDLTQLGLIVFGSVDEDLIGGEERVLVNYGPCTKDNFAWALNPWNSCFSPGCEDAYGGPPIVWTPQNGSAVFPFFDAPTLSHMPQCLPGRGTNMCLGSGTYTHRGLELASSNQLAYASAAAAPEAPYPASDATNYVNILITDGDYEGFSTDTEVQNALEAMYARGIVTYVLGFGEWQSFETQLDQMQRWGSGDSITSAFTAADEAQLQARLEAIVENIEVDPCCGFNDCSMEAEPTTDEPDTQTTTSSATANGPNSGGSGGTGSSGGGSGGETSGAFTQAGSTSAGAVPIEEPTGCGCHAGTRGRGVGGFWLLAPLALIARRRRSTER